MQLYYAPNTIAVATAIALEEAGKPNLQYDGRPSPAQLMRGFQEKLKYYEDNTWSGAPARATPEIGEAILAVLSELAADSLSKLWTGELALADTHSPVWKARPVFTSEWLSWLFEKVTGYRNPTW